MTGDIAIAMENWLHELTPREYQVALLVGLGLSNKEVARELRVSDGTVKLHLHNIFQKLDARNRYGLIQRISKITGASASPSPSINAPISIAAARS